MVSMGSGDVQKYLAELVGTYILVLTVGCNVLGNSGPSGIFGVASIAAALMVGIYQFGSVSGAHLNPAVTVATLLSNKFPGTLTDALFYIISQVLGGILAGLTYITLYKDTFNLQPGEGYTNLQAGVVELIYTFVLTFTVLNVACASSAKGNQYYGIAIAGSVIAGGYAVGGISGGAFNPAVALSVDIVSANKGFGVSLLYVVAELLGAGAAALAYRVIRPDEYNGESNTIFSKLAAEFLGTLILTTTVGFAVLGGSAAAPISIGAALMIFVYNLADVSGGHLNPAVTLAIYLSGRDKIDIQTTLYYVIAQIFGAIVGAAIYVSCLGRAFPIAPVGTHHFGTAAIAELVYTAVLAYTVLNVATTLAPLKDFYGVAIGTCVVIGGYAIGSVSGASLNPAVSIGIDFGNAVKGGTFQNSMIYTAAELAGGAVAAAAFYAVRPNEYTAKTNKQQV